MSDNSNSDEHRSMRPPVGEPSDAQTPLSDGATGAVHVEDGGTTGTSTSSSSIDTSRICANSELRPNDVLLGRGKGVQQYEGNIAFRKVVESRRIEYATAGDKTGDKIRLAREVFMGITRPSASHNGQPQQQQQAQLGGRFLKQAESNGAIAAELRSDRSVCYHNGSYWIEASEDVAVDKCKTALRQKDASARQRETETSRRMEKLLDNDEGARAAAAESTDIASASSTHTQGTVHSIGNAPLYLHDMDSGSAHVPSSLGSAYNTNVGTNNTSTAVTEAASIALPPAPPAPGGALSRDASSALGDSFGTLDLDNIDDSMLLESLNLKSVVDQLDWSSDPHDVPDDAYEPIPYMAGRLTPAPSAGGSQKHNRSHGEQIVGPVVAAGQHSSVSATASASAPSTNGVSLDCLSLIDMALIATRTYRKSLGETYATTSTSGQDERISVPIDDLHVLGKVLYDIFAKSSPEAVINEVASGTSDESNGEDDVEDRVKKGRRRTVASATCSAKDGGDSILSELGFPVRLSTLVDCLMKQTSVECYYTSIAQVEEDLQQMLDDPNAYLYDTAEASNCTGQLRFPDSKLYGRKAEVDILLSAYEGVTATGREDRHFVTISGYSGTGKTALVNQVRSRLDDSRAMMVSCKFGAQGLEQPTALLFRAFDEYCKELVQYGDETLLEEIKLSLTEALGSNAAVLKGQIPSLRYIIHVGERAPAQAGNKTDETNQILYYFLKFVQAVSGPRHPLVLFLDDLQWADQSCLDVVKMLLANTSITSTLFIGSYRDEEVSHHDRLAEFMGEITMDAVIPMSSIALRNLGTDNVNKLLSDCLHISQRFTLPLAEAMISKTGGNPMFVRQLLISLAEDQSISYSASTRRWFWDIEAIRSKSVADNAVDLIISMIQMNNDEFQQVLRVAALVGWTFDVATMERLHASGKIAVGKHIASALAGGLVVKDESSLHFAHDAIWQAAYGLTVTSQREQAHIQLARRLLSSITSEDELDTFLYTIVNQYNKGASLVTNHDEKLRLAELNLKAGSQSMSASSFRQASIYLLQGCDLLDASDWNAHCSLCLRIFTDCGEAQLTQGNADGAITSLKPVLNHCKNLDDSLRAHYSYLVALLLKAHHSEAIDHGLSVLQQLGESFPVDVDRDAIRKELGKIQALIPSSSTDAIFQRSAMVDDSKIETMRLLLVVSKVAFNANQNLMLLLILRMVDISLTDGLTPEASFAFAALSLALCGLGNHSLSEFCSRVSLSLLQRFSQKYSHIVCVLLNSSILPYKQPIQACVDSLRRAFTDGMEVGDVDWGVLALSRATSAMLFAPERSKSLKDIESAMKNNIQTMKLFKRPLFVLYSVHSLAAVQTLIYGSAESSTNGSTRNSLMGAGLDMEECLAEYSDRVRSNVLRKKLFCQLLLAYLFRRYDQAAGSAQELQGIAAKNPFAPSADSINEQFYVGLLACAMQRRHRDPAVTNERSDDGDGDGDASKWRDIAAEVTKKFTKWRSNGSSWNFEHKLDLLTAEQAYSDGCFDTAASTYDQAIKAASEHCDILVEALACERACIFHKERGDMSEAKIYSKKASWLYNDWEATAKAEDVTSVIFST